jgi:hypothetical protein
MTFLLGMALGSLITIGTALIFAIDDEDENYYN